MANNFVFVAFLHCDWPHLTQIFALTWFGIELIHEHSNHLVFVAFLLRDWSHLIQTLDLTWFEIELVHEHSNHLVSAAFLLCDWSHLTQIFALTWFEVELVHEQSHNLVSVAFLLRDVADHFAGNDLHSLGGELNLEQELAQPLHPPLVTLVLHLPGGGTKNRNKNAIDRIKKSHA